MEAENENNFYDRVMTTIYILAFGVYVYITVDQALDGAITKQLTTFIRNSTASITTYLQQRQEFKKSLGHVLWQVKETLEENEI